jgi:hypothetical protein
MKVFTSYRYIKRMVSFKPSPEWDVTATTAIHIKRTRNKNMSVYD